MSDTANSISIWGHQIPVLVAVAIVGLAGTIIGALIAALINLIGNHLASRQQITQLNLQLQHDFDKEHFARRQNVLEKASEDFERVHNLTAEASAFFRMIGEGEISEKSKSDFEKRIAELYGVHGPLDKELSILTATEGKLLLIGCKVASEKIAEYRQHVVALSPEILELKSFEKKVEKHFAKLNQLRDEFYTLLSRHYCEKDSLREI